MNNRTQGAARYSYSYSKWGTNVVAGAKHRTMPIEYEYREAEYDDCRWVKGDTNSSNGLTN